MHATAYATNLERCAILMARDIGIADTADIATALRETNSCFDAPTLQRVNDALAVFAHDDEGEAHLAELCCGDRDAVCEHFPSIVADFDTVNDVLEELYTAVGCYS